MPRRCKRRAAAAAFALAPLAAAAAALTDGTAGAVQSLAGQFTVPQSLGTVRGANLFHSFARFSVQRGEAATFTTSDAGIRHVIGRVTGGEASLIDGPLALAGAGGSRPSLWLVNPSGIVVGPGAVIDVPGSLHLSTAPQLRFADGFTWDTRGGASSLSVAAPESFGFLGPAAALRWQGATTSVAADATLELAAGDLSVVGAELYAGRLRVHAAGELRLAEGGQLWSVALPGGADGSTRVDAGTLTIERSDATTGIFSLVAAGAAGGDITLRVAGALTLRAGAEIEAGNFAAQRGGGVDVEAGSLQLDGQGLRTALGTQSYGAGSAGPVNVRSRGEIQLLHGAQIQSTASQTGNAGEISVSAPALRADGSGAGFFTGLYSNAVAGAGALQARIDGPLELRNAVILSDASGATTPDAVQIGARTMQFDGPGAIVGSFTSAAARGAAVDVRADESIAIAGGASVGTFSFGDAGAGALQVQAPRLVVGGSGTALGGIISATSEGRRGSAGAIGVDAGRIELRPGGQISSTALGDGNAGDVTVRADSLQADGGGGLSTGLSSLALGRRGDAGTLRVSVRDELVLRDGGLAMVINLGAGLPGLVDVSAGSVLIDGLRAPTTYTGIGGDAVVYQERGGLAAGSAVQVQARSVTVRNGGKISSSTLSAAPAGSVRVVAETIHLDGGDRSRSTGVATDTFGSGAAGNVTLQADTITVVNDAWVTSNTLGPGRGGSVTIDARRLRLADAGAVFSVTGVADDAPSRITGDAGDVVIRVAEAMTLDSGGGVFVNTGASGAAGRVRVRAGTLSISGADPLTAVPSQIASRARAASDGQSGSITLDVDSELSLRDGARLTIENEARVADPAALRPSAITVDAGSITLAGGAAVIAASRANANAGAIALSTSGALQLDGASVTTTSLDGDGGPVALRAAGSIRLRDASVTTSVEGRRNGNGGDITIASPLLLLRSGFVQANTAAPRARGGNVTIDVGLLVPDGSNVVLGGNRIEGFRAGVAGYNVIQAAAPEGLAGTLAVTLPQLDLSGSLVGLTTPRIGFGALAQDLCEIGGESSFTTLGRGALRPGPKAPLGLEP